MKVVCEKWKECRSICSGGHIKPHEATRNCTEINCSVHNAHCIPVQEIKYGGSLIKYGIWCKNKGKNCQVHSLECQKCEHFAGMDEPNNIVFCSHPKEDKEEELYVCDHAGECKQENCPGKKTSRTKKQLRDMNSILSGEKTECMWICKIVEAIPYKEGKKVEQEYKAKYKILTPCTMLLLHKKDPCHDDFRDACIAWYDLGYTFDSEIQIDDLISVAKKYGGMTFLISKGFIAKEEPEVFYKRGDRFKNNGQEYMLARVSIESSNILNLINLADGNIWANENIHVKNHDKVSKSEFEKLNYGGLFTKVSE